MVGMQDFGCLLNRQASYHACAHLVTVHILASIQEHLHTNLSVAAGADDVTRVRTASALGLVAQRLQNGLTVQDFGKGHGPTGHLATLSQRFWQRVSSERPFVCDCSLGAIVLNRGIFI